MTRTTITILIAQICLALALGLGGCGGASPGLASEESEKDGDKSLRETLEDLGVDLDPPSPQISRQHW